MATSPLNPWRVKMGSVAFTTAQTTADVAHELGEIPAFIAVTSSVKDSLGATATAETLTVDRAETNVAATVSFLVAG